MILHVACLPFPTRQGTQAAIDAMLRAGSASGHVAHLLTYAHGSHDVDPPYALHRAPDFPRLRSLRSGPSIGKVALDLRCISAIRSLAARLRPTAIVAHHVEAAGAALASGVGPVFYVAHTSLSDELPVYFPRIPARTVRHAANLVEQWICSRVRGVAAVAPSLARRLGAETKYLPVPWPVSSGAAPTRKRDARAELDLPADAHVCLYAGNLDPYQGWEQLILGLTELRALVPAARLLIATESDPLPARRTADEAGISDAIDFRRLDSEQARALAHAASDVAWVPRRTEGGLPIKMLDAFARGLPVVAMERATAGLPIHDVCRVVPNEDPRALAAATRRLFDDRRALDALRDRARAYLETRHDRSTYARAMHDWLGLGGATPPMAKRSVRRPRSGPEHRAP